MNPEHTFSATTPLQLRRDIPFAQALAYWRDPHARLVSQGSGWREYRQHLFKTGETGSWPLTPGVQTQIPAAERMDGAAELTFKDSWGPLRGLPTHLRILSDEHHAFGRTLLYSTMPHGGRWFKTCQSETERMVILIRRRPEVSRPDFAAFVHERLGTRLAALETVTELRTHVFFPFSEKTWPTFGVSHTNPPHGRFDGSLIVGGRLEEILAEPWLSDAAVSHFCRDIHAYQVEKTLPCVIEGERRV